MIGSLAYEVFWGLKHWHDVLQEYPSLAHLVGCLIVKGPIHVIDQPFKCVIKDFQFYFEFQVISFGDCVYGALQGTYSLQGSLCVF